MGRVDLPQPLQDVPSLLLPDPVHLPVDGQRDSAPVPGHCPCCPHQGGLALPWPLPQDELHRGHCGHPGEAHHQVERGVGCSLHCPCLQAARPHHCGGDCYRLHPGGHVREAPGHICPRGQVRAGPGCGRGCPLDQVL